MSTLTPVLKNPGAEPFYRHTLESLRSAGIPFLIGGTYAYTHYTRIVRPTKDLDVFIRAVDLDRVTALLTNVGYKTDVTYPHWLGKVFSDTHFIDIIFNLGNGIGEIDDSWFERAVAEEVLGVPVLLCAPEEMVWSKVFTMERERYDGADVAHVILACSETIDWPHLLDRFAKHWRVLLSHLILFGFAFPAARGRVPAWVMRDLIARLSAEVRERAPDEQVCQGTLLSGTQYLTDVEAGGLADARLQPHGTMTPEQLAIWKAGREAGL